MEDTWTSRDLPVLRAVVQIYDETGTGAPFQKSGAPRSGERIEKLNFLLRAAEPIPNCALADVPALVRF
jgi:hypothetical protein